MSKPQNQIFSIFGEIEAMVSKEMGFVQIPFWHKPINARFNQFGQRARFAVVVPRSRVGEFERRVEDRGARTTPWPWDYVEQKMVTEIRNKTAKSRRVKDRGERTTPYVEQKKVTKIRNRTAKSRAFLLDGCKELHPQRNAGAI